MKCIISNTITRKMTMSVAVLLVGITVFGVTAFGITDKTYAAESTLSLSIDNSTVEVDVAPTSTNGTFRKGTASTISASTNNATGYTISISAPSASGSDYDKLINTSDNTAKISSISSPTTEEQYKALNNTSYNNTWGYLPSKYCSDGTSSTCATNTDFLPAPTIAGDVLDQTTAANTTANTYTIGMGTRIDSTTKTGKYQGSFIVKLVANAIPYSIVYDDNVVSNMPTDVSSTTPDTSVTIDSKVPVRAGYEFLGWCNGTVTNTNGADSCNGTIYNPNGDGTNLTYTLDRTGGSNALTLTAMWKEPCAGYTKMQDMTAASAAALLPNVGSTATVCDTRDEQTYTIAKLKDNKYWMVENLNLAGGTKLSSDTTDFEPTYSLPTDQGWKSGGSLPDSSASGFEVANYAYVYNSGNKTNNCAYPGCYSYYSWDAATLGSGRTISTGNTDAPYSICPKGWKLPTSRTTSAANWQTTSDFYQLAHQYGLDSTTSTSESDDGFYIQAGPGTTPNFLLAGSYDIESFSHSGSLGYYWSATSYSDTSEARFLYFSSSNVSSAGTTDRYYGFSVRCILKAE